MLTQLVFFIHLRFPRIKQGHIASWTVVSYDNNTDITSTTNSRSISVTTSEVDASGRIVGGDAHNIKEFPFFASLLQHNFAACGGSILTSEYILSARVFNIVRL